MNMIKVKSAQSAHGVLGNTRPKPHEVKIQKKTVRSRNWCLTINNYTEDEYKNICTSAQTFESWIIGKEIGENKTPHLQMFIGNKNPVNVGKMKKLFPRAHIEKAKGNKRQNYDYCSKEKNFITNIDFDTFKDKVRKMVLKTYENVEWKEWQQEVVDLVDSKADARSVHWYYEKKGNIGKTFLCKYIALTNRGTIICDGKKDNVFNQVNTLMEQEILPTVVILDIPRVGLDYVNYGVIEKLKDGMLYSGKYEGGLCIFPAPIVICFANDKPKKEELSKDRWRIKKL